MALILSIQDVSKTEARAASVLRDLSLFAKGLSLVQGMKESTDHERKTTIANLFAAGLLTEGERAYLIEFYGWEATG
jgi:hypothetical protein